MAPPQPSPWLIAGAALVGLFGAVGAFVVELVREERQRRVMCQEMARLDMRVAAMRRELEALRAAQKQSNSKSNRTSRKSKSASSASSTTDDYSSALEVDSSDLEFYDLSDEENAQTDTALEKVLSDIDKTLDEGNYRQVEDVLEELGNLILEYPKNPELLWRLGKAHHLATKQHANDRETRRDHANKGVEACLESISLNPNIAEAHKWLAILVGSRSENQPIKERLADGQLFKQHLDIALRLKPEDYILHHMLGRYAYEIAGLKWYERKVAAALYAELPYLTYEDALSHCLEAEKLVEYDWKENKLLIAKCYLAMKDYKNGVKWLVEADELTGKADVDEKVDTEVKTLLEQYNSYR